ERPPARAERETTQEPDVVQHQDEPVAIADAQPQEEPAAPAAQQTPPAVRPGQLETTVTIMSDHAEQNRLLKDKYAVVRTSVPGARVSITSPDIATVLVPSPREVVVSGKAFGTTQLTLWSADNQQKTFDVYVELDLPMLEDAIHQFAPHAQVRTRMLSGTL